MNLYKRDAERNRRVVGYPNERWQQWFRGNCYFRDSNNNSLEIWRRRFRLSRVVFFYRVSNNKNSPHHRLLLL